MTKKPLHPLKAIALCLLIMPWHGCFGAPQNQIEIHYGNDQKVYIAYKPEKTIAEVKKELVDKTNISFNTQKLMVWGQVLRNRRTLQQAGVKAGDTLTLEKWKQKRIYIKTLKDKIITLDYDPQDTIQEIKQALQEKEGWPSEQQVLFFAGKELEDDKTLDDYDAQLDSTVHIVLRRPLNYNNNNNIDDADITDDNNININNNNNNNEINDNNNNRGNQGLNNQRNNNNEIKDNNNEIKNNIINPPNNHPNKNKNNEINDNNNNRGNQGLNNQRNNNNNNNEINDNDNTTTYVVITLGIIGILGIGYVVHNKSTQKPTKARDTSKKAT